MPLCHAKTAHADLELRSNEHELVCECCGFYSRTEIVDRRGKSFWQMTYGLPMSPDRKVAWPELKHLPATDWTAKEFGIMPGYNGVPEGFGVEEASKNE